LLLVDHLTNGVQAESHAINPTHRIYSDGWHTEAIPERQANLD
jgi:hypothetical protein